MTKHSKATAPLVDIADLHLPQKHPPLAISIAVGTIWLCLMLWLVLTSSNPVTLNRKQILRADAVVQVLVDDAGQITKVMNAWPQGFFQQPSDLKTIAKLPEGIDASLEYLIPITRSKDGFEVTTTRLPDEQRLIYPATTDAIAQLESLL